MNIYLLENPNHDRYDAYDAHVIRASTEDQARALAPIGDEGGIWSNPDETTMVLLATNVSGGPGVVLSSFNAG